MLVIKKDGQKVDFDSIHIYSAVKLAAERTSKERNEEENDKLAKNIESLVQNEIAYDDYYTEEDGIESTDIQYMVEDLLMSLDREVAISYIEYRHKRDLQREGMLDVTQSIQRVANKDKHVINENANKDGNNFPVIRDLTAGSAAKAIGLKQLLPKRVANAHIKGDIHFHDLDYMPYAPMTNCCLIDFKDMLNNGFNIGAAQVESPKSIQTATAQMAQIIANVASNQYGGCSADRVDEVLSPFAKLNHIKNIRRNLSLLLKFKGIELTDEDEREVINHLLDNSYETNVLTSEELNLVSESAIRDTKKDIFDAMQSLEYEISTLYSSAGQTPFVSLGFGLGTDWYAKEIQKSILEVRSQGLGKDHRIAIFPKLLFTIKEGVNRTEADPNYDVKKKALETTAKCMYPDILNYDKVVELTGNFKCPMGCRSFLDYWVDKNGKEVVSGRMNLGVTTLNLPRIAIQSKGSVKRFWKILDQRLDVLHEAMEYRIKRVRDAKPINAKILYKDGAFGRLTDEDEVWESMKDGRATISLGYIGLYEVGTSFYGPDWETNPEAKEFTLEVLKYLHSNANKWTKEWGVKASVYGTPSESLTDRFARMDREKFGVIENITDKEYYTNSFHYDTRKKINPFEKIDFESEYLPYTSGGFINYVELANAKQNISALEKVWDYSYDKVAYFAVNTPIDRCFECKYEGEFLSTEEGYECPECGNNDPNKADVLKRMCGYLGQPLARPEAHGRHKEIKSRVKHDV